jgi:hypothetical protein
VYRVSLPVGLIAAAMVGGCAAGGGEALSPDHPAHPDAVEAPVPSGSSTLALDGTDVGTSADPSATEARDGAARPGAAVYACPMHPKVRSSSPGTCPECGMALKPVVGSPAAPAAAPARQPAREPSGSHEHRHSDSTAPAPDAEPRSGEHDHGGHP